MIKFSLPNYKKDDAYYMSLAYNAAIEGWNHDEVPIGAVITQNDEVIATSFNQTRKQSDPTAHAEILAITMAAKKLGDWRLNECSLFVAKEPCPMCAGATIMSRLKRVCYRTPRPQNGMSGGCITHKLPHSNHHPEATIGPLGEMCEDLIQAFLSYRGAKSPLDDNLSSSLNKRINTN